MCPMVLIDVDGNAAGDDCGGNVDEYDCCDDVVGK